VVRVTDPYGRILAFLDRSRYFFVQVAPQLYSRGSEEPVPDPLLLRKSVSAGNRTQTSGYSQELCPLDHRGGVFGKLISFGLEPTSRSNMPSLWATIYFSSTAAKLVTPSTLVDFTQFCRMISSRYGRKVVPALN
jgi:hypothetical protein